MILKSQTNININAGELRCKTQRAGFFNQNAFVDYKQ